MDASERKEDGSLGFPTPPATSAAKPKRTRATPKFELMQEVQEGLWKVVDTGKSAPDVQAKAAKAAVDGKYKAVCVHKTFSVTTVTTTAVQIK